MNANRHIESLARTGPIICSLVAGIDDTQWRFTPPSGNWSILEIICHLADEEVEDFRTRLKMTLETPQSTWPPIDPVGAATTRQYKKQDPDVVLGRFKTEREASLNWLRSLGNQNWQLFYQHPKFGAIHAGDLLSAWAAHDLLHVRQITKRLFELNARDAEPFANSYAGDWTGA
jgi:hypothetical protein